MATKVVASDRARAARIARALARAYPDAWCELHYRSPWELLVATILSAQCTDAKVNEVTPALFAAYPGPAQMAAAPANKVEALIRPTGFYRQKAAAVQGCARALAGMHGGRVPRTLEELVRLPGVGRKTANVVVGTAFGVPAIMVDTHVHRVSRRLGLSRRKEPERIEADLQAKLPPREWTRFSHRLIWHGRRVCSARAPRCHRCCLGDVCPRVGVPRGARGRRRG